MTTIFILAVTVEALIEYAKLIFQDKVFNWKQLVAVVLGIGLALLGAGRSIRHRRRDVHIALCGHGAYRHNLLARR